MWNAQSKMEVAFLVVILFWILPGTTGNQRTKLSQLNSLVCLQQNEVLIVMLRNSVVPNKVYMSCTGSVVLTQTHPAAPYACRTGNITLRCQYDGVGKLLTVWWLVGALTRNNFSDIPGHTTLPRTTTYQELLVDSYINLATGYRCLPNLSNGSQLQSNPYIPQNECECHLQL